MKCSAKTFFDLWRSLIIGLFSKSTVEDRFELDFPYKIEHTTPENQPEKILGKKLTSDDSIGT